MSITLSSAEIEQLATAIRLLVSPLDHPGVDQWRSAVNRHLKELLFADSAGFLLPVSEGLALYSDEHDPAELDRYPDVVPPDMADGTPLWEQMIASGVGTLANTYGRHSDRYLRSAYYNEYAGANGAHDTLYASVSLGGVDARSMATLHFWHARPDGPRFGERETTLLRLLFPAFHAGVETQLRWGRQRQELLQTLDRLGEPALLCDLSGKVLHATPCMEAVLETEPEAERLRGELLEEASQLCALARRRHLLDARAPESTGREVRTGHARYRLSGCLYGGPGAGEPAFVIVGLKRLTPVRRSEEEIQATFALTRAEARVALLLGEGRSNAQVAQELFLSPHTARRHTEKILRKMGIRSRSEVAARLNG